MIILGVDYGNRRIGLAKSDPTGMLASGLDTFSWKKDINQPVVHIVDLTKSLKIEKIVIGMPRNMDGSYGERARVTREFADELRQHLKMEIVFWDERLTTVSAIQTLHAQGRKSGKDKGAVDRAAACHILQSYLDSL